MNRHRADCHSDDPSDEYLEKDRDEIIEAHIAGPVSTCHICDKRVANSHIGTHTARCEPDDHAEYGLVVGQ